MGKSLTLSAAGVEIDLYPWLQDPNGEGVEALEGIVGFGLPGVEVRWHEGAGAGATFRGARVGRREIELPFTVQAYDREALNEHLSRVSRVLDPRNYPARLTFGLPGTDTWYTDVVRSEGGDWEREREVSDNETWLVSAVTLESGDPYWTRSRPETFRVVQDLVNEFWLPYMARMRLGSGSAYGVRSMTNVGDADAWPVWYLRGPFTQVTLTGPKGERLRWSGNILAGQGLVIDTKKGTVKDLAGVNRYNGLATAPRFWSVPPGTSEVTVEMLGTSSGTPTPAEVVKTNYIRNTRAVPALTTGTFDDSGWSGSASAVNVKFEPGAVQPEQGASLTVVGYDLGTGEAGSTAVVEEALDGPDAGTPTRYVRRLTTAKKTAGNTGFNSSAFRKTFNGKTSSKVPFSAWVRYIAPEGSAALPVRLQGNLQLTNGTVVGTIESGDVILPVDGTWVKIETSIVASVPFQAVSLKVITIGAAGPVVGSYFDIWGLSQGVWGAMPGRMLSPQTTGPISHYAAKFSNLQEQFNGPAGYGQVAIGNTSYANTNLVPAEVANDPTLRWAASVYIRTSEALAMSVTATFNSGTAMFAYAVEKKIVIPANEWTRVGIEDMDATSASSTWDNVSILVDVDVIANQDLVPLTSANFPSGFTVEVGAPQFEMGGSVTDFIDGHSIDTTDADYSWLGAEYASASVRKQISYVGRSELVAEWNPRRWAVV